MKWNDICRGAALLSVIASGSCSASAQQLDVVRMVSTDYVPKPEILFTVAALAAVPETASRSGEKTALPAKRPSTSESERLSGSESSEERPTTKVAAAFPTWQIDLKDIYLANTFQRWASGANWRVRWDAKKNVLIEAPDQIAGSFEDAVRIVLEAPGIANSAHPLEVCFYPNTPPLARITLKGEQDKDCQ